MAANNINNSIGFVFSFLNQLQNKPDTNLNGHSVIGSADNINKSNNYDNLLGDMGFLHAFIASLSVIVVSELGDKTFFIAAIMAMRHPRLIVFAGAIAALALMTVLSGTFRPKQFEIGSSMNDSSLFINILHLTSVSIIGFFSLYLSKIAVFGQLANLIPRFYTYYISTILFAIFGLKMLRDGYYMSPNDGQEELEEVQSDLKKREDEVKPFLQVAHQMYWLHMLHSISSRHS